MAAIPRRVIENKVDARLKEISNLTVYLRRVGHVVGSPNDVEPPTVNSADLRVRPYVVQHPSAGRPGNRNRLSGRRNGLIWTTQLTCVVGDESALAPLVELVASKMESWRPVFASPYDTVTVRPFLQINEPGPSMRDEDERPPRYWTPLIFSASIPHSSS